MNSADKPSTTRLGLILFGVYLAFYLVFVFASAFASSIFETEIIGGLNLAIIYGFGLIILAFVLAILYGALTKRA